MVTDDDWERQHELSDAEKEHLATPGWQMAGTDYQLGYAAGLEASAKLAWAKWHLVGDPATKAALGALHDQLLELAAQAFGNTAAD